MQEQNLMFPLEFIIKNPAAHWTKSPTEEVRKDEVVVGVIGEGSEIRSYYSFCQWLTIVIRDSSASNADYERLSFDGKIAHDQALLPLTNAKEKANELFWRKISEAFPVIMHNVPSVRLCVDWQVVMSPEPCLSVPRDKDGLPCGVITRMIVSGAGKR